MTTVHPAPRPETLPRRRLLGPGGPSYTEHLAAFGPLPARPQLIEDVVRSGLTGRGGAGFPAGRKLASMSPGGVVIGNGSEGEPLSAKDRLLLETRPHLVLDGLLATATAVQAKQVHLVVGPVSAPALRHAIAERRDARHIVLTETQDRFVGGEASAVVHLLTGGDAVPVDHPVRLTTRGLRRRPTLVQNVETLAHIAVIARSGADAFRAVGHPADPGTRLLTIAGDVAHPGVLEAPSGASLRDVLAAAEPGRISGALVGGYHGAWVGPEALDRPLAAAAAEGAIPVGAGILLVIGPGTCGLQASAEIATYLAGETAGQCGPCVNGLPVAGELLARIADGDRDPSLVAQLERTLRLVDGRGACHHPDGTARLIRSALTVFADEVRAHRAGHCGAHR
ncbi:NADH-ubiquinone oxidoreductase-F iron-sulfur binding region domain-containing protein [Amnibacterium kyonggiense]|uniref:NADH:ubiquinone oxidoreductase subunit F (NADH-binding) n=1 Tax=Amnibacterium kyonggiense TaxID=595671 RepID=A0A4V3EB91_9MICO|nr:NADH-ubiquinone oxidoreductase-F iron-sulfur binding region domain-containing protein [Amnibacterium kyonggiense]TDS79484.1 NADH:ubiquinone oxidoreductase subunit F (NADH-binding) [Amnibacterium kyonggiense]